MPTITQKATALATGKYGRSDWANKTSAYQGSYGTNAYSYVGVIVFGDIGSVLKNTTIKSITLTPTIAKGSGSSTRTITINSSNRQTLDTSIPSAQYVGSELGKISQNTGTGVKTYLLDANNNSELFYSLSRYFSGGNSCIVLYNGEIIGTSNTYSRNYLSITACTITVEYEDDASIPTTDVSSVELGGQVTISIEKKIDATTHNLFYSVDDTRVLIASGVDSSYVWTPPEEIANLIPNDKSTNAFVICETFEDGVSLGEASCQITLLIPSWMVPEAFLSFSDISGAFDSFGVYASGVSSVDVAVSAQGTYGSTVDSVSVSFDGKTYSDSFNTGILKNPGEMSFFVKTTDSRGMENEQNWVIYIESYSSPSVSLNASRCQEDGTADEVGEFAVITISGNVSDMNGENSASLSLTYGSTTVSLDCGTGEFSKTTIVPAPSVSSLAISTTLSDDLFSVSRSMVLSIGYVTVDYLAGGKGISFGTTATKPGFTCAMDTDMAGHPISGLPTPQTDDSAATKGYVDAAVQSSAIVGLEITGGTAFPFSLMEGDLYQLSYISSSLTAADVTLKVNGIEAADKLSSYSAINSTTAYGGGQITRTGTSTYAVFNGFLRLMNGRLLVWGTDLRGNGVAGMCAHVWKDIESVQSLTISASGDVCYQKM